MDSKNKEKVICPNCGSDKIRTIVYGLLRFKDEEDEMKFHKEHVIGGCMLSPDNPHYFCDNCDTRF